MHVLRLPMLPKRGKVTGKREKQKKKQLQQSTQVRVGDDGGEAKKKECTLSWQQLRGEEKKNYTK